MKHNQALAGGWRVATAGLCEGHVRHVDQVTDRRVSPRGIVDAVVVTYECDVCHELVMVEHLVHHDPARAELRWTCVGVARPPDIHRMLVGLVERLRSPGSRRGGRR